MMMPIARNHLFVFFLSAAAVFHSAVANDLRINVTISPERLSQLTSKCHQTSYPNLCLRSISARLDGYLDGYTGSFDDKSMALLAIHATINSTSLVARGVQRTLNSTRTTAAGERYQSIRLASLDDAVNNLLNARDVLTQSNPDPKKAIDIINEAEKQLNFSNAHEVDSKNIILYFMHMTQIIREFISKAFP